MTGRDTPAHTVQPTPADGAAVQTRGVMGCFVVERREFDAMMYASEGGDPVAAMLRMGLGLWRQVAFAPAAPPACCCQCLKAFDGPDTPESFFVAIPYEGDGNSMVSGVCRACTRKIGSDGLLGKAAEHFRKFWPNSTIRGGGFENR